MTSNKPDNIAILLAAYNGENYIEQQISSILNQEKVNFKIFLSIDVSSDRTKEICENINSSNIEILPYGGIYGSAGKNFYHLINEVDFQDFDYIAFSDQDDIWKENKLERATNILKTAHADGYSSDFLAFWENKKKKSVKKSHPQKKFDFIFESAGPGCTFVITKRLAIEIKNKIQSTSPQFLPHHHDWFIYAYARSCNFPWIIDDFQSVLYRQHRNNQIGVNHGLTQKIKRINMLIQGVYRKQILQILENINTEDKKYKMKIFKHPMECRRNPFEAILLFIFLILGFV